MGPFLFLLMVWWSMIGRDGRLLGALVLVGLLDLLDLGQRLGHVLVQQVEQRVDVLVGDDGVILVRI